MKDEELIERLEEIIETIKDGSREQAEVDLADLYDEVCNEYDDYDEEEYDEEEEDENGDYDGEEEDSEDE